MGWMARALAAAGALLSLLACDPSGQVYEDLRLARLKPGESSEQDVRKLFGTPESVRTVGGGKGLVYPLGPEGAHTLLIKIGADREQEYKLKQETAWEWRFNDGAETRMFVVMFNAAGQVVSTAIEEDPRRTGGR